MPTENLLTPELLRRVAWSPPSPVTAESDRRGARERSARAAGRLTQTAQLIADAFVESVQAPAEASEAAS